MPVVTINWVQGEVVRIEDCKNGGKHVLTRGRQKYCDDCRPPKTRDALERQRRARSKKSGNQPAPQAAAKQSALAPVERRTVQVQDLQDLIDALVQGTALIERGKAKTREGIAAANALGRPPARLQHRLEQMESLTGLLRTAAERAAQLRPPPRRKPGPISP